MVSVKFNLSHKKRKDTQESEILLRVSVDRSHVFRAKTGLYVNSKHWDIKKQKVIVSRMKTLENAKLSQLQSVLSTLENGIIDTAINTSPKKMSKSWLERVIRQYTKGDEFVEEDDSASKENSSSGFFVSLEQFIATECKPDRAIHFNTVMRILKRYEKYRGKEFKLTLDGFSADDLTYLEKFLQIEHTFFDKKGKCIKHKELYTKDLCVRIPQPRGLNSVNEIMRKIRTFCHWAVRMKRTKNNPFGTYKIPAPVYGTPFFLTSEERDKLFAFDFSGRPGLAVQRDIFVFQSNVGMRAGDMYCLTTNNIIGGYLEYIANKTADESGSTIRVPLSKQAKTILERYKCSECLGLLPFISMQKYNAAIKQMLKIAGIDRVVTIINPTTREQEQHPIWEVASSHMARRNFIGNLYKKTQDPNAIGAMTGHVEGSSAFSRYRAIDDTVKQNLINQL